MFSLRIDFAYPLMQVLILPAKRGLQWLVEGLAIFRLKPMLLIFLVLGYGLTMIIISAIPYLGQLLWFILVPAFSVSLMNACRIIDERQTPPPQVLFSGFHRNLQALLMLGVVCILAGLAAFGILSLFDGGLLFRLFVLGEGLGAAEQADLAIPVGVRLLLIVLFLPIFMAFWFAPVLAAWHDMSAGKALFFSLVAWARNWRAFLMYIVAVSVCTFTMQLIAAMLRVSGANLLLTVFSLVVSLVFMPTIYASFYVSYRDVFARPDDDI